MISRISQFSKIADAAAAILDEYTVDVTQSVVIEPLSRELMRRVGCARMTARRHIAQQIRLRRGEIRDLFSHGGQRAGAGRPSKGKTK